MNNQNVKSGSLGSTLKTNKNTKYRFLSNNELPSDKKIQAKNIKTWNVKKESGLYSVTLGPSSLLNPEKHSSKGILLSHLDMS